VIIKYLKKSFFKKNIWDLLNTRYYVQILKNHQILRQSVASNNFEFEVVSVLKIRTHLLKIN